MRLAVVAGTANAPLGEGIACRLGVEPQTRTMERFPDGELGVAIGQVRGADVYLVQPTGPPVHDNLIELLMLADAARRSGAARVTAVIPYFAYARHDRREAEGQSLGGRVVADLVSHLFDRALVVDLHTTALEGFFGCPVEHLSAIGLLAEAVRPLVRDHVVVAPDLGAIKRAHSFARTLGLAVASVRKRRLSGREVEVLGVDGDVQGRPVLIVDDMISTGATLEAAARALRDAGATRTIAVATHGLLVPPAEQRLVPLALDALVVTDSLVTPAVAGLSITVVGLAPVLADAVGRLHRDEALAELVGTHG